MQRVFWNSICPALNHIPNLISSFSSHWLLETILRIPCFYSNRPSKFPLQYLDGSPPLFYSGLCSTINVSVRPSLTFLWRNAVAKPPTLGLPNFKNFSPFYISPLCLSSSVSLLAFYDPSLSEFELHGERFLLRLRLSLELAKRKNQHYLCFNIYFLSHLFCRIYYDIFF